MREVFDNAYLIAARHSLLTPDTLGFAYRENGEIFFKRSADSETTTLSEKSSLDGMIVRALFEAREDAFTAVMMYGGYAFDFSSEGSDLPVRSRKCRALFGDKVICLTPDCIENRLHNLTDTAYLVRDCCAVVMGDSISDTVEKALALEYSAKLAAMSSFLTGK